jgi:hypothetical protein
MEKTEPKYEHGKEVFYWDDEKYFVIKGTVVFTYYSYVDGEFDRINYILSTKDNPLPLDISSDEAWRQQRYSEEMLYDSYNACLDAEYDKEMEKQKKLKEELEKSEDKVQMINMLRG